MTTLSHRRWALPILAQLAQTGGSRFVPLSTTLGISRDALRQTLDSLIRLGLVIPNPGYGHPSRPEYVLTDTGRRVAPECARLVEHAKRHGLEDVAFRKWSLPTIAALDTPRRFGEVRLAVGATARALTLTLRELVDAGLVERRVHDDFPPRATYRLTPAGRGLRGRALRLQRALDPGRPARAADSGKGRSGKRTTQPAQAVGDLLARHAAS